MNKFKVILILLVFLTSCFKQDAPVVNSDQSRTVRDYEQLKACSDITFYEGFLYRNNLINLFICTSWDKKFTEMFRAISGISEQSWNDFVSPVDAIFFGDKARRDRFIKYYQDLDNDGALDDLGRVITALTDTNFFDGWNAIFECTENQDSAVCKNRDVSVEKDEIKNLFLLFERNPNLLLEFSKIIDGFHDALGGNAEKLRREIVKFNDTSFFKKLRLLILSTLAEKYVDGLLPGDLELMRGLFSAKEPISNRNWLNLWVKRSDVTPRYINKLLQTPVLEQPQLIRDIKVLNKLYDEDITCSDGNLQLSIDIKSLISNTLKNLRNDDIVKFFDSLLLASESVGYARPICPDLTDANRVVSYYEYTQKRNINHAIDLGNVLNYSVGILAKVPTIDFVKFSLELVHYDHEFLMNFISSDLINVSNEINRVVVENSEEFYTTTLSILKESKEEMFYSVAYVLNDLFYTPQSEDLLSWAKSWLFWKESEQNFIFNFIDTHLDEETNYVRLFSFYSLLLKEVSSDWSKFSEYYNRDEETRERIYQAFKEVFSKFHGEKILADYKKFFSRDHILELLKVITAGDGGSGSILGNLSIKNIDERVYYESPNITLVTPSERDGEDIVKCVRYLSESRSLFDLTNNYPQSCVELNNSYFLDNLSHGISKAVKEFGEIYPNDSFEYLFEPGGILSPEISIWIMGSALSVNSKLEEEGKEITFLVESAKKFLFDIGLDRSKGVSILNDGLSLLLNWLGRDSEENIRNGAILELVNNKNRVDKLFLNLPHYIDDFEIWNKNYISPVYTERKEYSCAEFINIHVGGDVCPDKKVVTRNLDLILQQMIKQYEASEGTPVEYIIKAALPDGGVQIPLDGKKTKNKKLTLYETFNYLYDLSDKSLKVNREKVKYKSSINGDKQYYTMTTSERIDHVIRNVAFRDNYLGVQYLNAVVKGDDYSDVVKEKQRLMGICLNTPGVRCGKSMTKEDRWKGKNALWAYDGLVDVNNGNDLEPRMKYGEFMQAFMYSFVASSALDAQEVKLFPLDDDVLKKHNGKALGYVSDIAGFSNMGRVVHDRIGRTREEFLDFINKPQFMRVNNMLLSRVPKDETIHVVEQLINTMSSEDQNIISDLTEWVNDLEYSDMRIVEEIVAKSIYISTYLGSEKQVYGIGNDEDFNNSTSFEILYIINEIMNEYKLLKKSFANSYLLKNTLSPTLNFVSFLYDKLSNEKSTKDYWFLLNSGYSSLREVMFVRGGVTSFITNVVNNGQVSSVYDLVFNIYKYLIAVEKVDTRNLKENFHHIYESSIGMTPFWDYLENTTVRSLCSIEGSICNTNANYDALVKISYVLNRKNNLEATLDWLLIENKEEILNTVNDFFPYLQIDK